MNFNEQRPHVVMLLSNPYEPDVRAQKQAHILAVAGYRTTVIGWDRTLSHVEREREEIPRPLAAALADWDGPRAVDGPQPISIVRVRKRAGWRQGARHFVRKIPYFWWHLLREIRQARPAILHAHQLDTLPVAYLFGRLYGVPVIYDAREYYPGMLAPTVGPAITAALEALDKWLTPRVAAVLAVGERHAVRHRAMGGRVWIVHNSQIRSDAAATRAAGAELRRSLGIPATAFVLVYVGNLTDDRLLTPVLEAVAHRDDVFLVIAGDGPQAGAVQAAAQQCSRIRAVGHVPLARVDSFVAASDVVYYGLNAANPNSFYFMPNLAFFAFAAGRALLVTPTGEIAEVVRRESCGVVMETASSAAADVALQQLRDDSARTAMAASSALLGRTRFDVRGTATALLHAYAATGVVPPAMANHRGNQG